jgi:hypothetical protein
MPKTDSSVHNQKVFVTLEAIAELAVEYRYWADLLRMSLKDKSYDAGMLCQLKGRKEGYEQVIGLLSLPIRTTTD